MKVVVKLTGIRVVRFEYNLQQHLNGLMLRWCAVTSSDESEEKEDEDGEHTRKRYFFRQRKTVERYQAPLESKFCIFSYELISCI